MLQVYLWMMRQRAPCPSAHPPACSSTAGWQSSQKRLKKCGQSGRVVAAPASEAAKDSPAPIPVQGSTHICRGEDQQPAPCPTFLALSIPKSLHHSTWGCQRVRRERAGRHFKVISLGSKQHLHLVFLWLGCQEGQLPRSVSGGGIQAGKALQYLRLHI